MITKNRKETTKAVLYLRVSTKRQGQSGLGIASQRRIGQEMAKRKGLKIVAEFEEHESGKRTTARRPALREALDFCGEKNTILVIARMDRLTRNFTFLSKLVEAAERDGIGIVACDVPEMDDPGVSKFMWRMLASVAEMESDRISKRTREGFKEAKQRGVKLGSPEINKTQKLGAKAFKKHTRDFALEIMPVIEEIEEAGIKSYRGIARALNSRGIDTYQSKTARETGNEAKRGMKWTGQTVKNVLTRKDVRAFKQREVAKKKRAKAK